MTLHLSRLGAALNSSPFGFKAWADKICTQLETAINGQQDQIDAITALQTQQTAILASLSDQLAQIEAAQAAADAAQTSADTAATAATAAQGTADAAQTTATTVKGTDKLSASFVVPTPLLTSQDAGSDARIVIADHTRYYGDGSAGHPVTGETVSGLPYDTIHYIYYDDPTFAASAVTYVATTTASEAQANRTTGRHFCGAVTTPVSGGADVEGGGVYGPGMAGLAPIMS